LDKANLNGFDLFANIIKQFIYLKLIKIMDNKSNNGI